VDGQFLRWAWLGVREVQERLYRQEHGPQDAIHWYRQHARAHRPLIVHLHALSYTSPPSLDSTPVPPCPCHPTFLPTGAQPSPKKAMLWDKHAGPLIEPPPKHDYGVSPHLSQSALAPIQTFTHLGQRHRCDRCVRRTCKVAPTGYFQAARMGQQVADRAAGAQIRNVRYSGLVMGIGRVPL
jgi:hypothetical protein